MSPGYHALRESTAWFDLPGRGLLAVTGPDRERFLNAMVAADVRRLIMRTGCYTLLMNAKGRIIADATVYAFEDGYLLETESCSRANLHAHLNRHLIADDALVDDVSSRFDCMALEGPESASRLLEMGIPLPEAQYCLEPWEDGWVMRAALAGGEGFRFFVAPEGATFLRSRLREAAVPIADALDIRTVRLERGKPRWPEEIHSRYLGPELGEGSAIATGKGCYLGQEVAQRIRARGLLTRSLARFEADTDSEIHAGEWVHCGDRKAGHIAGSAFSPWRQRVVGLAYLGLPYLDGRKAMTCGANRIPVMVHQQL